MTKKNVILISDFEFDPYGQPMTGYSDIACSFGKELQKRFNVIGMGVSYRRNQHWLPFSVTTVPMGHLPSAIGTIFNGTKKEINKVIFTLDIPMLGNLINSFKKPVDMKCFGIFAVEGDPLIFSWAVELLKYDKRYAISQFGADECNKNS